MDLNIMMNVKKKLGVVALAGAVLAGVLGGAQAAQAAQIAGTITISPTSGNVNTDTVFLDSIAASVGAPVGYRALSGTFVYQGGVQMGSIANGRTTAMASTYGTNGLDGNPAYMDRSISPTNNFVSNKLLNQITTPLATGPFELRFYYFASSTAPDYANDPYLKLDMTYDATTGAWGLPAAPAITTTTSLTAGASASTVTLTATVKDGAATATAAAGSVVFKEGATTVATVPVASGVASASLTGVADGAHSYTAQFQPSNGAYSGSTSAPASVQVGGITATSNVTATIPTGVGTLTLTGVSSTVALGTAALSGGTLNASGNLASVVTDSRQLDYPAWSLTGQVGNFTAGSKTLDGKYLGWTPAVSGDAAGSAAGAVIAPAPTSTDGLKVIRTLATGSPNAAGTITNASAVLLLKAPANTPAGAYSATLTLTLI
ncbi:MAG TPA: Ig-like domain-containing protein [Pseudolysinimonas sp.]|nr:Ig-like domain-containing protein [Pseudolysinimonas sp.]